MLYVIIFGFLIPAIFWSVKEHRRKRHQTLAGFLFDKCKGHSRFEKACIEMYESSDLAIRREDVEKGIENWKSSFRIDAGQYLQRKYTIKQLSGRLSKIKTDINSENVEAEYSEFINNIEVLASENARKLLERLQPNTKTDQDVMGRRRRRR